MTQNKTIDSKSLQVVIGRNLKTARQDVARLSLQKVMQEVWGVTDSKNRISELETGLRMPSVPTLVRLSMLYGVSLDFLCGLSSDIERDLECARAGQITQGLREIAVDTVDRIGMALAHQVAKMPRMDAVLVKEHAQDLVKFLKQNITEDALSDDIDKAHYFDLLDSLSASCVRLDVSIARHSRIMELTIYDHISKADNKIVSEYLTDHSISLDQPLPNYQVGDDRVD